MNRFLFFSSLVPTVLLAFFTVAGEASAVETTCPVANGGCCVNNVAPGANCTANDLTFVLVGLGIQSDGCYGDADTLDIELRAIIENTTAQTRYDVGVWVATDGDPNADGALTGQCARETLTPVSSVVGSLACTDVELTCGDGPYYNAEGDSCGDLVTQNSAPDCGQVDDPTDPADGPCTTSDGIADASVLDFVVPITVLCNDSDDDGFSNLDVCLTYGNQANQVDFGGANGTCDSAAELEPGTNAKCQCEDDFNSNIPVPDLSLSSCTCPGPVRPGRYTTCTYSFANTDLPNCTPDPSTPAQFRCGSGAYFRFDADYDQANGTVSNISVTNGAASDDGDVLAWRPDSAGVVDPTPDSIILEGQSGTLDFRYNVDAGAADGTINIPVTSQWSADGTFSPLVSQALTTNCQVVVQATWASVTDVRAVRAIGAPGVVLEWSTAAEVGSVDFRVERLAEDGRFVEVGRVPAVGARPGGHYRIVDPDAPAEGAAWRIVERDTRGGERVHGPFERPVEIDAEAVAVSSSPTASSPAASTSFAEARRPDAIAARPPAAGGEAARETKARPASSPDRETIEAVDLAVVEAGIHQVDLAVLADAFAEPAARVAAQARQGRLRASHRGTPIATWLSADGDALRFHVEPADDPLAAHDTVRVTFGKGVEPGRSAASLGGALVASVPARLVVEEDLLPRAYLATDPLEDFWFQAVLSASYAWLRVVETTIDVPDAVGSGSGAAELVVGLRGFSPTPRRVAIEADGTVLGEAAWIDEGIQRFAFAADPADLADGTLDLRLEAVEGDLLFDGVELAYRRAPRARDGRLRFTADIDGQVTVEGFEAADLAVWAIDEPGSPTAPPRALPRTVDARVDSTTGGARVTFAVEAGTTYLAVDADGRREPTSLVAVGPDPTDDLRDAEHLVVAADAFADAAERLAAHRRGAGKESRVVLWSDVVAHHGHGVPTPFALRDLLGTLARDGRLESVVLLGAGTFDVRDRLGAGDNLLPPLLVPTAYGLQPADGRFVDHGTVASGVPALALGRVPVVTPAEAEAWVDKVIAVETAPTASEATAAGVLILSDNADAAGDFPTDGDVLAARVGAVHRSLGRQSLAALRADLLADFGAWQTIAWLGHGGLDRFADEGVLTSADVPALAAGDSGVPTLAALTCNVGYFAFPAFRSLGENLVLEAAGGVLALVAPSGLSAHGEAVRLGTHLLETLDAAPAGTTLGDAWLAAIAAYLEAGGDPELVSIYNLLGDPESPARR